MNQSTKDLHYKLSYFGDLTRPARYFCKSARKSEYLAEYLAEYLGMLGAVTILQNSVPLPPLPKISASLYITRSQEVTGGG